MRTIVNPAAPYRLCPHGFHHPPWPHSCDGCWCEGERDQREYGWPHDTTPEVCPHEDCPCPKDKGDKDCGNHEDWMT